MPARMRSSVDLPAPFAPTSPVTSSGSDDQIEPGEQRPIAVAGTEIFGDESGGHVCSRLAARHDRRMDQCDSADGMCCCAGIGRSRRHRARRLLGFDDRARRRRQPSSRPDADRRISSSSAPDWPASRPPASWSARASPSSSWRPATGSAAACSTIPSAAAPSPRSAASTSGRRRTASPHWPRRSGVDTFKTYNDGSNLLLLDGKISRYPATGLPTDPAVASDIIRLIGIIDGLAKTHPGRRALDGAASRRVRQPDARDVLCRRRFAIPAPGC